MPRRRTRTTRWAAVFGAAALALAALGAELATAGGGTAVFEAGDGGASQGEEGRHDGAFWVFVSLPHPTTTSRPYLTHAACEAARDTHEPGATMGCHLKPLRETSNRPVTPRARSNR